MQEHDDHFRKAFFRKKICSSLVLKSCARSLCLGGWRDTQQEPEDENVAHQQERHVHGQEEPGHTKMEKRQVTHPSLVHGEHEISDPHQVEQPDQRERPSWQEPEREDRQQGEAGREEIAIRSRDGKARRQRSLSTVGFFMRRPLWLVEGPCT